MQTPDSRRAVAEIAAVVLAAALHAVATLAFGWRGADIAVIGAAFVAYAAVRLRHRQVRSRWGLDTAGLRACARDAGLCLLAGGAVLAAAALARGTLAVDLHFAPLLLLYPLWGLVQQVLVLGLVADHLDAWGLPRPLVVAAAALGFAAVHAPDWPLVGATLLLGAVNAVLFFRHRCVWPLALLHGWLGVLFYRWVLGRDVWAELLAAFG